MRVSAVRHYCTYFDRQYLTRGVALYQSLVRHVGEPFTLWILCFDEETYRTLAQLGLPNVRLVPADDFERANPELRAVKAHRMPVEYYWSSTPTLPLYIFATHRDVEAVTYLDADLLFFSSPQPVYDECGDASILLIPHRWAAHSDLEPLVGTYNVQMMMFRRTPEGLDGLQWWQAQCLEWCSRTVEEARFGDQKYLDDWPRRFRGVHVLKHKGAGVAPWNVEQYALRQAAGRLYVDKDPLIFYHYHGFALLNDWMAIANRNYYRIQAECIPLLYRPYLRALQDAVCLVRQVDPVFQAGYDRVSARALLRAVGQGWLLVQVRRGTAAAVWRQRGNVEWPSPLAVLRRGPGLLGRSVRRAGTRLLRTCGSSRP